jgi:signal transduction histidine kinase
VTVEDTGIGISAENQTSIFDKFGQLGRVELHSSGKTKFKGGGPGLGLPIAKGILEAHGGSLWVESPGHDETACPGSTFHMLIPARTEAPDPNMAKLFDALGKNKS